VMISIPQHAPDPNGALTSVVRAARPDQHRKTVLGGRICIIYPPRAVDRPQM
jgi:hypothetical protein